MNAALAARPALPELHPDAVAVSAFRALPDGTGRQYTVSEAPSKGQAIRASLHRAKGIGFVKPADHVEGPCDCYAVLDVLDANDDIVQDFCIPTRRAFEWWYRHLDLRVVDVEAEVQAYYGKEG